MTFDEAVAEAAKRERHKSKHLSAKRWTAVNEFSHGWKVKLVDVPVAKTEPKLNLEDVPLSVVLFGKAATLEVLRRIARQSKSKC